MIVLAQTEPSEIVLSLLSVYFLCTFAPAFAEQYCCVFYVSNIVYNNLLQYKKI